MMVYSATILFFVITGFLSAWLSFSIAYLMLKSWLLVRQDYLLGFPVGFGLLAFAYTALDINYVFPMTNAWNWERLLLGTFGFSFLAVTYFLRYGAKERDNSEAVRLALGVLGVLTICSFAPVFLLPESFLPSFLESESAFRIANLVLLGYVIYSLGQALKTQTELSSVVLGFTFLVIEQFNLLLHAFDRAFVWSVVFAELVRVVGLLILAIFLVRGFQRVPMSVK
jgi:hypothetical protein